MGVKYDEKSCGVVLYRDDKGSRKYLILRYPSGHWDLAKGHVEEGETEHETATRELLEETGIADLTYVDGFREEISYRFMNKGKPSHKQVVFFLGKTSCKDVHLSHEHHDSLWLSYEDAMKRITFDNAQEMVKKAESVLSK